jgi:hypothetical protein
MSIEAREATIETISKETGLPVSQILSCAYEAGCLSQTIDTSLLKDHFAKKFFRKQKEEEAKKPEMQEVKLVCCPVCGKKHSGKYGRKHCSSSCYQREHYRKTKLRRSEKRLLRLEALQLQL